MGTPFRTSISSYGPLSSFHPSFMATPKLDGVAGRVGGENRRCRFIRQIVARQLPQSGYNLDLSARTRTDVRQRMLEPRSQGRFFSQGIVEQIWSAGCSDQALDRQWVGRK